MQTPPASIETRRSWSVALACLGLLTLAYGAPLVSVVALKPMAESMGVARSIPALAVSAAYIGSGCGGLLMGWIADRVGVRRLAVFGLVMVAAGCLLAAGGRPWQLLLGHGVLIGLLGLSCLFAPMLTLVSRWFDQRRGTAVALVASGQYTAGVLWPSLMELSVDRIGWQWTLGAYGLLAAAVGLPLTLLVAAPPQPVATEREAGLPVAGRRVLGMAPNAAQALICAASFLCCIPMALPQSHLVAFCSDIGLSGGTGAAMMSAMLGVAFFFRQFWGWIADRWGGLQAVLGASLCQATSILLFMYVRNEVLLFAVAALSGVGLSGLIPAYVVTIRALFPDREAGWRIPMLLLAGQGAMAVGGWLGGAIYDRTLSYGPAFTTGLLFNLANLVLVVALLLRLPRPVAPRLVGA